MFRRKKNAPPAFREASPSLFGRLTGRHGSPRRVKEPRWSQVIRWIIVPVQLVLGLFRTISNGVFALVLWLWHVVTATSGTRRVRHLLEGLPAVFATIGVLVVGGIVLGRESQLRDEYQTAAHREFSEKDYQEAYLYYERLFKLDGGTAETRLYLGLSLDQLGRSRDAMRLIRGVAEGDAGGDYRANAWIATKLLADEELRKDPRVLAAVYRNLLKAERGMPNNLQVKLNLANYHVTAGDFRKAIPYLEGAAELSPIVNIELARYYSMDDRGNSARVALERAEEYLRSKLNRDPVDRQTRILLSKTASMLGDFGTVLAVLEQGLALDPDGPYPQLIAETHIAIFDRLSVEPVLDHGRMIHHLRQALRYRPGMVDAIVRLVGFGEKTDEPSIQLAGGEVNSATDSAVKQDAKALLREMLARGIEAPSVHMALGLKAWRDNDYETARQHFEAAYDLDPTIAEIANNLAWILTHQKIPQPERALSVINTVLERHPNVPRFRDTRGEAYLALGQWDEAIRDLEFALSTLREDPRIHLSLAKAYEAREQPELAEAHRDEARRLRHESEQPSPVEN